MIKLCPRTRHSQQWHGRSFTLNEASLFWGRYTVPALALQELRDGRVDSEKKFSDTSPEEIASAFEHLLSIFVPNELDSYLSEIRALTAYSVAKEHAAMLVRSGCWPDEYSAARAATAVAFEDAMLTVFNASATVHGLKSAARAQYRQILHGMHVARIFSGQESYDVAFTSELVLECIESTRNWTQIWPRCISSPTL